MRPLAVAHRAGNDLATLATAVELGADVIEADVHAWHGRLEVRHSKALGPLPWLWERPGQDGRRVQWIPATLPRLELAALLSAAPPDQVLLLDLKGAGGVGPRVAAALARRGPDRPVLVCGRWWPSVDVVARQGWARPVLSARNPRELALLRRRVRGGRRPYGVSIHRPLLTTALVAELHERVELVLTWPVNDAAALEQVLRCGVSGVTSDEPTILRSVLALR